MSLGNGLKAFSTRREDIVRGLAELLQVNIGEADKVLAKMNAINMLKLHTMIGKRVVSERSKQK